MKPISKREFLKKGLLGAGGLFCFRNAAFSNQLSNSVAVDKYTREAMFYSVTPRGVKCLTCPNECTLKPGELSVCHDKIFDLVLPLL